MNSLGLLLLRLVVGIGLAWHGFDKVFAGGVENIEAMVTDWGWPLPQPFAWVAALTELVGGVLVTLGLYTRYAAVPAIATMAVALIQVHPGNPYESGGELPLLYLVGLVVITLTGPGRYSVDGEE
ncbi:MAG: DoxD-like family protein [Planctomycetota bacterium]|nr:MAG: DoxD-like family protein [Planctomycetota bacterium]